MLVMTLSMKVLNFGRGPAIYGNLHVLYSGEQVVGGADGPDA